MNTEPTEPMWNEEDIEDDLMNDLPDGRNNKPLMTREDNESFDALNAFFHDARIH